MQIGNKFYICRCVRHRNVSISNGGFIYIKGIYHCFSNLNLASLVTNKGTSSIKTLRFGPNIAEWQWTIP
jgi:hypothetical protein